MASKPKPEFVELTTGLKGFEEVLSTVSNERLVVVDVHQEWCGPTVAIMSFLNQLWIDLDDANRKISLYTLALDESSPEMAKIVKRLQAICDPDVKIAQQGCKPLFLVLRNGMCVGTVDGVNTPSLSMYMKLHLPKPVKA
jgi:thioredoxin-like negative regulator of GroEL